MTNPKSDSKGGRLHFTETLLKHLRSRDSALDFLRCFKKVQATVEAGTSATQQVWSSKGLIDSLFSFQETA